MFKGFWNFKQFGNHLMPNTLIFEGKSLEEITKWQKYYNYGHLNLKIYSWYNLQLLLFSTTKNFNNIK
jgi:hypothetical protein